MSVKDAVQTVLSRNVFYRDGYRLLLRISILQGLVIVLMGTALFSLILITETRQIYFATTSDGRIINIVPLAEPFRGRAEVIAWAASKSKEVMTFGYNDFRQQLQRASENFTPRGWESFTKAMKEARILEAIEARKLTVKLEIEAAPEIRSEKIRDGVYTWLVSFPATISFDGNDPPEAMQVNLMLLISRVSTLQNPAGIGIEHWIAAQR
ncbi:MAG TPA: type IV secretion protein IcmL [Rhodospirillaceae bacterium]|nr:type IV secretion protein IcmL [Rhodospirillaceae bacterium]